MEYDVVIVGAGPSGSTAAKTLAEKGINVLLVDKEHFPREKPCGGGLPLRTLTKIPYIQKLKSIESYSYGGYIYSSTLQYKAQIKKTEPVIAMVQRSKFDHELVQLAKQEGAEFQDNKQVTNITVQDKFITCTFKDNSIINSELVIGSDGFNSTIAKKTNLLSNHIEKGMCILENIPMDRQIIDQYFTKDRLCHIHSRFDGIRGYGWVFPKHNHINVGIVSYDSKEQLKQQNKTLKQVFMDYIFALKENNILSQTINNVAIKGGILPITPLPKTYSNRILISGDAAGLINPISGEGIYYAILSGKIAGETAAEAIKKCNTTEKYLSRYEQQWKQEFGREINMFLRSKKLWGKQGDMMVKLMQKDRKFAELIFLLMVGKESAIELRGKIIKRYIYNKIFTKTR